MIFLILSYLCLMISGILWGAREKFHQSNKVFKQLFGDHIEDVSFWGPQMDRMKYKPSSRTIRQLLQWFPVNDYWHSSWYVISMLYVAGIYFGIQSDGVFWDLDQFWPMLGWFMVIKMFWGGTAYWAITVIIKNKK